MQFSPKLIAIHGLKGSGKDTAGRMIRKYVEGSIPFAFGDHLKNICSVAFGVPIENFYLESKKEVTWRGGKTPRLMMTSMADALKGNFGDSFFSESLKYHWANSLKAGKTLVVTDLRHEVEEHVCRELGAVVIHVQRPDLALYSDFTHLSEKGLKAREYDIVLDNSQDKLHLLKQVRTLVGRLWGPGALAAYPFVPTDAAGF